jgi:FkbM family methyltransferase
MQLAFESLLRPGDVVWDVGAHIGFFSLLASRLVGPAGEVVAFEPVAQNRSRLKKNLSLNPVQNVSVRSEAVAAISGKAVLHPRGSSSMWSLIQDGRRANGLLAVCITLDDVARETGAPALIKVDVEDAELDVLRGARRLLRDHRPTILVELLDPSDIKKVHSIADGYVTRRLSDSHWALDPLGMASDRLSALSSLG